MRVLILTAAAVLVIGGTAVTGASAKTRHHHFHEANASMADDGIPADTLSPHDAYVRNLHDAGYSAHSDLDSHGNMKQNY